MKRKEKRTHNISPSKLADYAACPLRYDLAHRQKVAGIWGDRSPVAAGKAAHKALELAALDKLAGGTAWGSASHLEDCLKEANTHDPATYAQALEALEAAAPVDFSHTTHAEQWMEVEIGGVVVGGIVDRVDQHPDGMVEVIDYKYAGVKTRAELEHHPQTLAYLEWAAKEFPDARKHRITYHYLVPDVRVGIVRTPELSRIARGWIPAAYTGIKRGVKEANFSAECAKCPFNYTCPAYAKAGEQLAALEGKGPGPKDRFLDSLTREDLPRVFANLKATEEVVKDLRAKVGQRLQTILGDKKEREVGGWRVKLRERRNTDFEPEVVEALARASGQKLSDVVERLTKPKTSAVRKFAAEFGLKANLTGYQTSRYSSWIEAKEQA